MVIHARLDTQGRTTVCAPAHPKWKARMRGLPIGSAQWLSAEQSWRVTGYSLQEVINWIKEDLDPEFDFIAALDARAAELRILARILEAEADMFRRIEVDAP